MKMDNLITKLKNGMGGGKNCKTTLICSLSGKEKITTHLFVFNL